MSEALRLGLIGTGNWARTVHAPSAAGHPDIDFVGVWGRDHGRATTVAREFGIQAYPDVETLFERVDAVSFAVPPPVQVNIALRAAQHGRHLLLEKPIATTVADALRLERAVADAHVASIVFFTQRFLPGTQRWLAGVMPQGGWVAGRAEITLSSSVDGRTGAVSGWRREFGALWDIGPHALALLWPVLGDVRAVVAGTGDGDQVHLVLRHEEGRSSTVSLTLTAPLAATGRSLSVYGAHGRATLPPSPLDTTEMVTAHRAAVDALIEAAHGGHNHPCDVHFGVRVVEVLAAAQQSLATGCRVEVVRAV
jgi:predicted dehydrogenase